MKISMQGKVVFVTGSARRVGKAIALEFARQGARLVIHHSNSPDEAEATREEILALGTEAIVVQGDHSHYAAIDANFASVQQHYQRLDVMVNSAAIFPRADFLDITPADWEKTLQINLFAPFWCSQLAARLMQAGQNPGAIINISDNFGERPWTDRAHHGIAKAGVNQLTQVAALALAPYQIRVNAIIPGPVLKSPGMSDEDWQTRVAGQLPLGRDGNPDDVARAALFLAENDFITGTLLRVDGGEYLYDRRKKG